MESSYQISRGLGVPIGLLRVLNYSVDQHTHVYYYYYYHTRVILRRTKLTSRRTETTN
jgi:hypothetical protein